jgi:hypothetical protein
MRHGQRMFGGFVAVAIYQHDLILTDPAEKNDHNGSRRAIRVKIGHIGAEHLCSIPLGFANRS